MSLPSMTVSDAKRRDFDAAITAAIERMQPPPTLPPIDWSKIPVSHPRGDYNR